MVPYLKGGRPGHHPAGAKALLYNGMHTLQMLGFEGQLGILGDYY